MSKANFNPEKENKDLIFLKLNSENIIEIEFSPNLYRLKKEHLIYINDQIRILGGGKRMAVYINVSAFIMLDKGAKKYRATDEYTRYRLANAFLVDSFSKVVLFNFYMEDYTPSIPVKSFPLREKAFTWLKDIQLAA